MKRWKDAHKGELAAILMSGPSLNDHDLSSFPGLLFGVNGSWRKTPVVDYWCAQDVDDLEEMARGKWTFDIGTEVFILGRPPQIDRALELCPRAQIVKVRERLIGHRFSARRVFSEDLENEGASEHNSGLFTLQIATWMGCDPIWLLGLDCEGGHFYPDKRTVVTPYANIAKHFEQAALGLGHRRIYNANRNSLVRSFEFRDFNTTFGRRSA